jgi:hypothetical protein
LATNSPLKKAFSLICILALFTAGLFYVLLNFQSYLSHEVVTQIKLIDAEPMPFPAVTFCNQDYTQLVSRNLSDFLVECNFDSRSYNCSLGDDFQHVPIYDPNYDMTMNCFKFNGGKLQS